MQVVERTRTRSTEAELRPRLVREWERITGERPSKNLVAFMLAQTHLETAAWNSLWNHNIGNITARESYPGKAWRPPWFAPPFRNERDEELHEKMLEGKAPSAFRAYDTLDDGVSDYVRRLVHDFPEIPEAAETGSARLVAEAIRRKYCPEPACDPDKTEGPLGELAIKFGADTVPAHDAPDLPAPRWARSSESAGVALAGLAVVLFVLWRAFK